MCRRTLVTKPQIRARFHGSDAQYRTALNKYGITEQQLLAQLRWQLTVLRFIDQRFRPAVLVTDQAVQDYYNQHVGELRRTSGGNTSLQALRPKVEEALAGEQVNQQFFAWLNQARTQAHIEFRDNAFK